MTEEVAAPEVNEAPAEAANDAPADTQEAAQEATDAPVYTIPDKDDKEGWDAYYKQLGRPDDAKSYEFSELPEGLPFEEQTDAFKRETAFEMGLNAEQAKAFGDKLDNMFVQSMAAAEEAHKTKLDEQAAALQKEWGDDYKANMDIAKRAVKHTGVEDADLAAIEGVIGADRLAKLFYPLGQMLSEGQAPNDGSSTNSDGITKANAQAKYEELSSDKEFIAKVYAGDVAANKLFDKVIHLKNN